MTKKLLALAIAIAFFSACSADHTIRYTPKSSSYSSRAEPIRDQELAEIDKILEPWTKVKRAQTGWTESRVGGNTKRPPKALKANRWKPLDCDIEMSTYDYGLWGSLGLHGNFYLVEGNCRNDLAEGKGVAKSYEDSMTYVGDFKNGKFEGAGVFDYGTGRKVAGFFQGGKVHGHAVEYKSLSGDYTGRWEMRTEGNYRNGKIEGFGKREFADGSFYEGEFLSGKYHGMGLFVWADGRFYEGEYSNGQKHGVGVFKDKHGNITQKQWAHGIDSKVYAKRLRAWNERQERLRREAEKNSKALFGALLNVAVGAAISSTSSSMSLQDKVEFTASYAADATMDTGGTYMKQWGQRKLALNQMEREIDAETKRLDDAMYKRMEEDRKRKQREYERKQREYDERIDNRKKDFQRQSQNRRGGDKKIPPPSENRGNDGYSKPNREKNPNKKNTKMGPLSTSVAVVRVKTGKCLNDEGFVYFASRYTTPGDVMRRTRKEARRSFPYATYIETELSDNPNHDYTCIIKANNNRKCDGQEMKIIGVGFGKDKWDAEEAAVRNITSSAKDWGWKEDKHGYTIMHLLHANENAGYEDITNDPHDTSMSIWGIP